MTVLFISNEGESLGLAMRVKNEGYSTYFYTERDNAEWVGEGLVDKTIVGRRLTRVSGECIASNVNRLISEVKPDLVIVDGKSMGKVADYIKEQNIPVFGSSYWTDSLSTSPPYVTQLSHRIGIDMWEGEKGVSVECGVWWNGLSSLSPFLVYNEDRFMDNSLGMSIPSAGNVVRSISPTSKLYKESIEKMERLLKKSKFRGVLSIGCVVTKGKVYCTHFTSSLIYFPSLLEIYKGSVTDLLSSTANGRKSDGQFTADCALSFLLSTPPYPISAPAEYAPIKGISPSNLKHVYLLDVQKREEKYEAAEASGKIMWVSARGRDVGEAKKRVQKTISNLSIPDIQYRMDIGRRVDRDESLLNNWKYI